MGVIIIFVDDFLPDYQFGKNALDTKIYLGKIITSHPAPLKILGNVLFLDSPQPDNVLSFDPVFKDSWVNEVASKFAAVQSPLFRFDSSGLVSPRVIPIHLYLNDFYTNFQIAEFNYENENSIIIPPGKYYLYVMIDPYGKLYGTELPSWSGPGGEHVYIKRPVISFSDEQYFTISFRK